MASDEMFETGLATRKAVLGDEYVEQALARPGAFNQDLQRFVTSYCWGEVWGRPGLSHHTRSLVNVAMITVLNRPHELRLHAPGAIRNGCTMEEIEEVLLQVAVYAGIPAALDGLRVAREAIAEAGLDGSAARSDDDA